MSLFDFQQTQPMHAVEQSARANHIEALSQSLRDTCARSGVPFNWSLDFINSLVHNGRVRELIAKLEDDNVHEAIEAHTQLAPNEFNKMIEIQAVAWVLGLQVQRVFTLHTVIDNRAQPRRLFHMPTAQTLPTSYPSADVWICVEIDQVTQGELITWRSFLPPWSTFDMVDNIPQLIQPLIIDDNATIQPSVQASQHNIALAYGVVSNNGGGFHNFASATGHSLSNVFFTNPAITDDVMGWSGRLPASALTMGLVTSPLGPTRDLMNEDGTWNSIISDSENEEEPAAFTMNPSFVSTGTVAGFRPLNGSSRPETHSARTSAEGTDIDAEGETDDDVPLAAGVEPTDVPGDSSSLSSAESVSDEQSDEQSEEQDEEQDDEQEEEQAPSEYASEPEDVDMSDYEDGPGSPDDYAPSEASASPAQAPAQTQSQALTQTQAVALAPTQAVALTQALAPTPTIPTAPTTDAAITNVTPAPAALRPILTTTEAEVQDILTDWEHVTPKGHDLLRCLTWFNNSSLSRELDVVPSNVAHARKKALVVEEEATGVAFRVISEAIDEQRVINTGRK